VSLDILPPIATRLHKHSSMKCGELAMTPLL
jgi:hypothetical protein